MVCADKLVHEFWDASNAYVLGVRYENGSLFVTLLEERATPQWEGLGVANDSAGREYLESYRAFVLNFYLSNWLASMTIDAVLTQNPLLSTAIRAPQIGVMFKRSDTGDALLVPASGAVMVLSEGSAGPDVLDVVVVRSSDVVYVVPPHRYYYLDPPFGPDGHRTSTVAVYEFFHEK